jgi:hypothetical protein
MLNRTRNTIIILVAAFSFAGTAMVPTVAQAAGGTCTKPGDILETTTTYTLNGKVMVSTKTKEICGKDGKWHTVVDRTSGSEPPRAAQPPSESPPPGPRAVK